MRSLSGSLPVVMRWGQRGDGAGLGVYREFAETWSAVPAIGDVSTILLLPVSTDLWVGTRPEADADNGVPLVGGIDRGFSDANYVAKFTSAGYPLPVDTSMRVRSAVLEG